MAVLNRFFFQEIQNSQVPPTTINLSRGALSIAIEFLFASCGTKYNGNGSRRVRSPKAIEIGHMTLMFDAMVSRTLRGKKFTRPHLNNALTATYLACIPENCNRFARYGQKTSFYAANFMHLTFLFGLLTAYESLPTTSARQTLYRTTIRDHIKTTTSHKEHWPQ